MSRTKRFLSGVTLGYVNQFLLTVVGLWLTPFLLRRIGQHDYGLWLVGTQVITYLLLMDFGIVALLPREAAFATGRAGGLPAGNELPVLVGQTLRLVLWQTPFVAVVALGFWLMIPADWGALSQPMFFVLLVFVLTFPLRVFQATLYGLQDLGFLSKAQICTWLLGTALTVALVFAGVGLYALALGWITMQAFMVITFFFRVWRRFPQALPRHLPPLTRDATIRQLRSGLWISINQIAVALLGGTDVLVIGKLLGPIAVVPYACTGKLVSVLSNQPQMLVQLALPALSELRISATSQHLKRVSITMSQAMLLLSGAVVCVVIVVNRGFVGWWVGAGQFGGITLTALVLMGMLLRHWNLTVSTTLFSFGRERRLALTALLDGIVTVICSIVLTKRLGLVGAPLGSMIGVCSISLPSSLYALSGTGVMSVSQLLSSLAPWFWRFAALAFAAVLMARSLVPNTFTALAAASLLTSAIYSLVMLPIMLRDPVGYYIRPRLLPLWLRFSRVLFRSTGTA